MLDFTTLKRGSDNRFYISNNGVEEELTAIFDEGYDCPEAFEFSGVTGYEPMTAKEIKEGQEEVEFSNANNYIEEKFDGTRALVYFFSQPTIEETEEGYCRVFSRRISKKTGFYNENTDSLPQIREINVPEMNGTILDGELFIDGLPFKEVSSTLNCLWDKAIDRQIEKGYISLHAFDIIKYKGIDLRKMKLERRKHYLHLAIEEIGSPYVQEVGYYPCETLIDLDPREEVLKRVGEENISEYVEMIFNKSDTYPELSKCILGGTPKLTPKAFYELIITTGGEGVIIKPKDGKYLHKRGKEYLKVKKFLTRDLIVIGFEEPTKEYSGKNIKSWGYWENDIPVTRHYHNKQVGNLVLGVTITDEEIEKLTKKKEHKIIEMLHVDGKKVIEVCVCGGFDDDTRDYFTRNKARLIGSVVEVKANELFKDTGFMRHPRYMRMRPDKNAEECIWKTHID